MWQGDVRDVEPWNPCGRPLRERYSPGETKDKAKDQLFYIDGSPYSTVEVLNFETILRRFPNLLLITFAISVGSSAACTGTVQNRNRGRAARALFNLHVREEGKY